MGFLDSHTPVKPPGQRQLFPAADGACSRLKLLKSCSDDQVNLVGGQQQHETMFGARRHEMRFAESYHAIPTATDDTDADLSFKQPLLGVASDKLIWSASLVGCRP